MADLSAGGGLSPPGPGGGYPGAMSADDLMFTGADRGAGPGALVISLDFELHWGVRDWVRPGDPYQARLLGAREAIPPILDLFHEFGIQSTWATVGFLFASTEDECRAFWPSIRPRYDHPKLSPYQEPVGKDESADPLHFAWSLVERIASAPGTEVASHTFSHYLCLESGQDEESFRADLDAARRIASWRGIELQSLVLPRNQWNPEYGSAVRDAGFRCYRGPQRGRGTARGAAGSHMIARGFRLADAYVNLDGPCTTQWTELRDSGGLCSAPASRFLRADSGRGRTSERLHRHRITSSMRHAARTGSVFHLWWHPHNFGVDLAANLGFLRSILEVFTQLRESHGMNSLTMAAVADQVLTPGL